MDAFACPAVLRRRADYVLLIEPVDDADAALLPIAQTLVDEGLMERPTESGPFEVTELGRKRSTK